MANTTIQFKMNGRVNILGKEGWEGSKEGEWLRHVIRSTLVGGQMIDISVFRHILFKLYDINAISREFY
jgi:hypothetical protein